MLDTVASPPLIELQQVTKTYGSGEAAVHALAGLDLNIDQGEFIAVMGSSGSGKSTAMNIIGCLDEPTTGFYHFMGIDVRLLTLDQRALLRRNFIGFIFQGFNLLPRTSALENVELPLIYRGMKVEERRQRSLEALEMVGLGHRANHTPGELSGGQQQRVAIARAIVTDPFIMLADEPTGNVDTKTSIEIMDILTRLNREQGITILMVTHEPDIAEYANRLIHFVDGTAAPLVRASEAT